MDFSNRNIVGESTFQIESLFGNQLLKMHYCKGIYVFKLICCWGIDFPDGKLYFSKVIPCTNVDLSQLSPVQNAGIHVSELLLGLA